jgi:hypothetical protein
VAIYRVERALDEFPKVRAAACRVLARLQVRREPVLISSRIPGVKGDNTQCRVARPGLLVQGGTAALFVYALPRVELVSCPPAIA